jgi:hypothetical protein
MQTQKVNQPAAEENQRLKGQHARIGQRVIDLLGEPRDLYRVQVVQLWEGRYRVNVLIGPDAASAQVAHSFFLSADDQGNIAGADPAIARRY